MKFKIDINCDLGESYGAFKIGNDEKVMPHITSANIACGFHAGDPVTIAHTAGLAKKYHVAIGAHPGYPDVLGFGRREIQLTSEEIRDYTIYQISALHGFASTIGTSLQHVKLHGALYNSAAKDEETSIAVVEAVQALNPNLIIFAPPKSVLANIADKAGLRVAYEFFADRAYNPDGSLVSRRRSDALIQEKRKVVERVIKVVKEQRVIAINGYAIDIGQIHTICVHGDTSNAVELTETLKRELTKADIEVTPVENFL